MRGLGLAGGSGPVPTKPIFLTCRRAKNLNACEQPSGGGDTDNAMIPKRLLGFDGASQAGRDKLVGISKLSNW
jgi:hypothetical protein